MAAGKGDVLIYALCDPDSLAVRYVGKTTDMKARMRSHKYEAASGKFKTRKANWLRSLNGREPVILILATAKQGEWCKLERHWIKKMKDSGCDLTNHADGGQTSPVEGVGHTEETKAKLREIAIERGFAPPSRAGLLLDKETKDKISEAIKIRGNKPPNMGGWNKGKKKTHCIHGHEFTEENTCMIKRGDRQFQSCRSCAKTRTRKYQLKKRK